jgi:anti-sigma factor RsiW
MNEPVTDHDVMAFADGQLPPQRAAAVEIAITADPELARRVAEIRQQNADLVDAFDPVLAEPIPARLLEAARHPRAGHRHPVATAFAMAATLVLGLAIGWYGRELMLQGRGTPTTFAREAAFTHVLYATDQRRPVEVWANEEKGLVTWLTKRLGHAVNAPDLNPVGFALVGGRLVAGNAKPTGLLMYENAAKQRLTLQLRVADPSAGETAFRYAVENGVGVFYWVDESMAYALSGDLERGQLLAVAKSVYDQVGHAAPAAR